MPQCSISQDQWLAGAFVSMDSRLSRRGCSGTTLIRMIGRFGRATNDIQRMLQSGDLDAWAEADYRFRLSNL